MRPFREVSIKRKLMSIIMLTCSITLFLACGAFMIHELSTIRNSMTSDLKTLAEIIGNNSTAALEFERPEDANTILATLRAEKHIVIACIYDNEGRVFSKYIRGKQNFDFNPPRQKEDGIEFKNDFLVLFQPILLNGQRIGTVHMKSDLMEMYACIKRYSLIAGFVLLAAMIVAFILSSRLQRVISLPILLLAETARSVTSEKDYAIRAADKKGHTRDELDTLIEGFNEMLSQIQKRDNELRKAHDQLEQRVLERTRELQEEIRERIRAEKELKIARDEALEASHIKSVFLANMSHEIRTPMNGIIGMTELALDTELTEEQAEFLNIVRTSADSLLTLINDILDFSKIEAGKLEFFPIGFNLRDSVGEMLNTLGLRAHEKNLELACRIPSSVPDALVGDPGRLRQILINLVGNAIKFTEEGEVVVRIETRSVTKDEAFLHFSVSDTGIGIPKEMQTEVFEAFTQVDGSTTRKYSGTGLGLAISAQLVHMMGGEIWVDSATEVGSSFHFTTRFGIQTTPVARLVTAEPEKLQGLTVLIVDDNATNRRILDEMVKNWKMKPATACSGMEALYLMKTAHQAGEPFGMVLLDGNMPEMDGFMLARRIKEDQNLDEARLIMLTSSGQRGDAARCRELGVDAYLMKPIMQSDLLDAIMTALGLSRKKNTAASLITRHSLREARHQLRILLAEDNPVNQKVAVRILEKQGHVVNVAGNGLDTVAALEENEFDLILMDIQMPKMGGFEATTIIREKEKKTGKHVPIIALTAHAMKGDQENCFESGMDGYVSKPINPNKLFEEISRLIPVQSTIVKTSPESGASQPAEKSVPSKENGPEPVINKEAIMERLNGDESLLAEISGLFIDHSPEMLDNIREAIEQRDRSALESAAHAFKGSVSNFFATAAVELALKLETMGRNNDMAGAREIFETLEEQVERLKSALA